MTDFGILNWSIVTGFLIGTLILGFFLSRRVKTADDYHLGTRTTPWWAIGLSVVATYVGALTFLGGPAWAYNDGFVVILIHVNYPIVIFVVINLFLPFFYNSGVASIYEYLERRFGHTSRSVMSAVFLMIYVAYGGIMLYATALVLQFITGIDVVDAILIIAVVALAYTLLGGISAVIWTDVAQTVVLLLGAFIVLFMLIDQLAGGLLVTLGDLKAAGKTDPFNYSLDPSQKYTIWTGIIAMSVYHVVVYGASQNMVQRTLAAKTLGDAKKAYMMMGYAGFFIFCLFFLIGILFYSYYDGRAFDNENMILLEFVSTIAVPGLLGIVTVAIVAAAMSSLDSALNSMATVTTLDFYQQYFNKHGSPQHYLKASRLFTVIWALLIVLPAILFTRSEGSVLETLSKVGVFFVGAKVGMFGLGFFSKHTTERGLLIGVVASFLTLWYVEMQLDVAWPWYAPLGGAVCVVVGWGASILWDGFQSEYHPYTVQGQAQLFRQENRQVMQDGWYVIPGKIDRVSYLLLLFFIISLAALWFFKALI